MCKIFVVNGEPCINIGELSRELGGPPFLRDDVLAIPMNTQSCLCHVSASETALAYGLILADDDGAEVTMRT
jgi:hypothetical protein